MSAVTALDRLASDIRVEVDAAEADYQSAIAHAIRAGELLLEAKAHVGHGRWLAWLGANVTLPERTARHYMRLARESATVADLPSVRDAVALLTEPRSEPEFEPAAVQRSLLDDDVDDDEAVDLASAEFDRLTEKYGDLGDVPQREVAAPAAQRDGAAAVVSAPSAARGLVSEVERRELRLLIADLRLFVRSEDAAVARRLFARWNGQVRGVLDRVDRRRVVS